MNKKEFENKYLELRRAVARKHEVDMGVATDMLIAHVQNRKFTDEELKELNPYATPEELRYNFDGCEDLDYTELDKDIAELIKLAEAKRKELGI